MNQHQSNVYFNANANNFNINYKIDATNFNDYVIIVKLL